MLQYLYIQVQFLSPFTHQGIGNTFTQFQSAAGKLDDLAAMYQLFIFFMITDPKTTVSTRRGQCVVAFLVAAMEAMLRLMQFVHAPYYALFIVGPAANLIEIAVARRAARLAAAPAPGAAGVSLVPTIPQESPRVRT